MDVYIYCVYVYSLNQEQTPSLGQKDGVYKMQPTVVCDAYTAMYTYTHVHGQLRSTRFEMLKGN